MVLEAQTRMSRLLVYIQIKAASMASVAAFFLFYMPKF
jgi:hypothetical protein